MGNIKPYYYWLADHPLRETNEGLDPSKPTASNLQNARRKWRLFRLVHYAYIWLLEQNKSKFNKQI